MDDARFTWLGLLREWPATPDDDADGRPEWEKLLLELQAHTDALHELAMHAAERGSPAIERSDATIDQPAASTMRGSDASDETVH